MTVECWQVQQLGLVSGVLVCLPILLLSLEEEVVGELYDICQNSSSAGSCTHGHSMQN